MHPCLRRARVRADRVGRAARGRRGRVPRRLHEPGPLRGHVRPVGRRTACGLRRPLGLSRDDECSGLGFSAL